MKQNKFQKLKGLTLTELKTYPNHYYFRVYFWNKIKSKYTKIKITNNELICLSNKDLKQCLTFDVTEINKKIKITLDKNYKNYLNIKSLSYEEMNKLFFLSSLDFLVVKLYLSKKPNIYKITHILSRDLSFTSNIGLVPLEICNKSTGKKTFKVCNLKHLGTSWKIQLTENCSKYLRILKSSKKQPVYKDNCYIVSSKSLDCKEYSKKIDIMYLNYSSSDSLTATYVKSTTFYKTKDFLII